MMVSVLWTFGLTFLSGLANGGVVVDNDLLILHCVLSIQQCIGCNLGNLHLLLCSKSKPQGCYTISNTSIKAFPL